MNFVSIRIITADIKRLARFYEQITGSSVTMYTEDFGELKTASCTLAMGSTRTLRLFGGDVARPAENHTAIIEFRVNDVDAEYRKLARLIGDSLVQEPTTMPWGNRSLLCKTLPFISRARAYPGFDSGNHWRHAAHATGSRGHRKYG
jgi:predicted enzyme related to lactoylglutathione lyase